MKNTFFSGLLLLCLLLASCGGKKQAANIEKAVENTTDSNIEAKMDNDKSSIKSSDNTPTIGQVLHANYFDVTANKVSVNNKISTGNEYSDLKQEEGNVYLVLNITFKNTDNESRTITAGTIWINYNGKDYSFDKSETIMVNGWGLLFEQINPLTSKTTNLVYKIPVEVKGDAYYQPGRAEKDQLIYLGKL